MRCLITGITGQDGSYLAEQLLAEGHEVHGVMRRSSSFSTARIEHIFDCLHLHYADLTDGSSLHAVMAEVMPDEVYNLAAQSHVAVSFKNPAYTVHATALGYLNLLEAVRVVCPEARIYQASSSEMFGSAPPPQNEQTPFHPRSPYACAKVYSYWQGINYREAYGMHVSNGILFNHESPRRLETFVTRKVTRAAARIKLGLQDKLVLGNLDARRDWGFAGDYTVAMRLMVRQDNPGDYVVATGETHSVREFVDAVFGRLGLDSNQYVETDAKYYRPAEVDALCGDTSKAREVLGWKPVVGFDGLVDLMVAHDMDLAAREKAADSRK